MRAPSTCAPSAKPGGGRSHSINQECHFINFPHSPRPANARRSLASIRRPAPCGATVQQRAAPVLRFSRPLPACAERALVRPVILLPADKVRAHALSACRGPALPRGTAAARRSVASSLDARERAARETRGQDTIDTPPLPRAHRPGLKNMSSSACYKCNRMGHFARECPQGGGGGRGDRGRDRDGGFGRGREKCFKCNQFGHFARECKEDQDLCYRCNGVGHIAKDCQQGPELSCYNCNKTGHMARSCPEGGNDSGRFAMQSCYNCNKTGHIARNCTEAGGKTCYICGKTGHISRECDQDDRK